MIATFSFDVFHSPFKGCGMEQNQQILKKCTNFTNSVTVFCCLFTHWQITLKSGNDIIDYSDMIDHKRQQFFGLPASSSKLILLHYLARPRMGRREIRRKAHIKRIHALSPSRFQSPCFHQVIWSIKKEQ